MTVSKPIFFHRGRELYPALEQLISEAENEILLNFYIFKYDAVGKKMLSLLEEKARKGVRARIIFDDMKKNSIPPEVRKTLARSSLETQAFRPLRDYFLKHPASILYRNHVRIFLIDRKVFGLGGICIGEVYDDRDDLFLLNKVDHPESIAQFFEYLWQAGNTCSSYPFRLEEGATPQICEGTELLMSGPRLEEQKIYEWTLQACRGARSRIAIITTWFFPPRELLRTIIEAAERGVKITVITPLRSDKEHYDGFRALPMDLLLKHDIKWYGTKKYFHQKFLLADDNWRFGSSNFDIIGLKRNYELDICGKGGEILGRLEENLRYLLRDREPITSHPTHFTFRKFSTSIYGLLEYFFTAG